MDAHGSEARRPGRLGGVRPGRREGIERAQSAPECMTLAEGSRLVQANHGAINFSFARNFLLRLSLNPTILRPSARFPPSPRSVRHGDRGLYSQPRFQDVNDNAVARRRLT